MITNIEKASELFKPIEVSESGTYIVSWDYSDITKDEMKFKNSAFVPTGKKILTGRGKWKTIYFSSKPSFYSLQNHTQETVCHTHASYGPLSPLQ